MARKRLCEILIAAGALDERRLRVALNEQRKWGGPLGRLLVDLRLVPEEQIVQALSTQLHIPVAEVDRLQIDPDVLDLIPPDLARQHNVLPFRRDGSFLDVAMSDPTNMGIIDELRMRTRLDIQPHIAGPKALERAIQRFYVVGDLEELAARLETLPLTVDLDASGQPERPFDLAPPPAA